MTAKPTIRMTDATRDRIQQALASGADDCNPAYLFSTTHTTLLLAIEAGMVDTRRLARAELVNRGLDADGAWCGFPKSREIHVGEQHDDAEAADSTAEQVVAEIARKILYLDTIETRNSDALDFHEIAIWTLREVLIAAYNAGAAAASHATEEG